jgi:hypothetical protein
MCRFVEVTKRHRDKSGFHYLSATQTVSRGLLVGRDLCVQIEVQFEHIYAWLAEQA